MTELTTIEKIDAMLAALDVHKWQGRVEMRMAGGNDGTGFKYDEVFVAPERDQAGDDRAVCSDILDPLTGKMSPEIGANIAWLLNAARPMLEAARETYTIHKDKASADAFRYMDATTTDIIAPLWKAFTEAEHD